MVEGVAFRLLGPHVEVAHGLCLLFSLGAVAAVYALGAGLASPRAGSIAAVLLASWPPFLVQTTMVRLDMPVATLSVITLLAAFKGWPLAYVVLGSLAALTKAPGVLASAVVALAGTIGLFTPRFRKALLWVPVGVYATWLVACKLHYGWFLYPENVKDFSVLDRPWSALEGLAFWMRRLMVDQWAWVPMGAGVLAAAWGRWLLLMPLAAGIGAAALIPGIHLAEGAAAGLFIALAALAVTRGGFWWVLPAFALAVMLLFSTYLYRFPRYMLLVWPGLAICCGFGLARWRFGLMVALLCAGLMGFNAFSDAIWRPDEWSGHESTFTYRQYVRCRKVAADYLQVVATGRRILAAGKAAEDLTVPALGYVDQPLSVTRSSFTCEDLAECGFYYELRTLDGETEEGMRLRLRRCDIRAIRRIGVEWRDSFGVGEAIVYSLDPT
jgi:hypothetical protein